VLAMPPEETIRYESSVHSNNNTNNNNNNTNNNHSDDSSCNSNNDYAERRNGTASNPHNNYQLPVTVPDYTELRNSEGDKYIIFNVHMAGRHVCSRRYREFDLFSGLLRREFPDYVFPGLPSKWPFKLSYQQLEARRKGLESFLEKG
jgi:sorting nexin-27